MTQFALVKIKPGIDKKKRRHLASFPSEGVFCRALPHVFSGPGDVFVLSPCGRTLDEVYLSAQWSVADGTSAGETVLFQVLDELRPDVDSLAFWYGEDFVSLPSVFRWVDLYAVLREDLEGGALETYVVYSRTAPI